MEELRAREEAEEFDLQPCPCCQGHARVLKTGGVAKIACGKIGCKIVEGINMAQAAAIWNERRFSEAT